MIRDEINKFPKVEKTDEINALIHGVYFSYEIYNKHKHRWWKFWTWFKK